jgi:hypothetical protein
MKVSMMISLLLLTTSAHAAFFSSADLFRWLENDMNGIETYEGGMGKGYLLGALDMLASTLPPTVCYPKNTGISAYEVKSVVYQYMLNHPDSTGMKPDKLVYQALTEHWPCK